MRAIGVLVAVCLLAAGCTATHNGSGPPPAAPGAPAANGPGGPDSAAPAGSVEPAPPAASAANALRITSPHSGDTLALPAAVQYELGAVPTNPAIRVYSGSSPTGGYRDFNVTGAHGTITLPDDKTLAGHRTLTFCLAGDGRLIENTCVTLDLTLTGRK
jgi:hypothetical protein